MVSEMTLTLFMFGTTVLSEILTNFKQLENSLSIFEVCVTSAGIFLSLGTEIGINLVISF